MSNTQWILAERPQGRPDTNTFTRQTTDIPTAGDGEFVVKLDYISLDPAMRGWLNDAKSYIPPVQIGEVMRALGGGTIVESKLDGFPVGAAVTGSFGMQQYAVCNGDDGARIVDTKQLPMTKHLSVMGMTGMTAYFCLFEVGKPQAGETVVISGAAGAVGSVAGQLAKAHGCRVVGIAGGSEKCAFVVSELGFDACIDYKNSDVDKALKEQCPKGIDVYFDNVGGDILDAALARLAPHARIAICGAISQYNNTGAVKGPSNYLSLLVNRATMQGFVVFDWIKRYGEAGARMGQMMADGHLKSQEDIVEGIDTFPETLLKLFDGGNQGKLLLKV